jgi:hypothetical protein
VAALSDSKRFISAVGSATAVALHLHTFQGIALVNDRGKDRPARALANIIMHVSLPIDRCLRTARGAVSEAAAEVTRQH